MGYGITHRPYHTPVVRNQVTKSIELNLETMMEEMRSAFEEMLGSPKGMHATKLSAPLT